MAERDRIRPVEPAPITNAESFPPGNYAVVAISISRGMTVGEDLFVVCDRDTESLYLVRWQGRDDMPMSFAVQQESVPQLEYHRA